MIIEVIYNQENKFIRRTCIVLYATAMVLWNHFFMLMAAFSLWLGWYVAAVFYLVMAFYMKLSDMCDHLDDIKKQKEIKTNVR